MNSKDTKEMITLLKEMDLVNYQLQILRRKLIAEVSPKWKKR